MQAVGRLGSYISRSVYTVSGPFHPFGGAVDIIIVEQPDGSYKSSPWYVRFGKFQGVLKTREKVVSISVNGVDTDFNMYLDHKGEAFFLKEVEVEGLDSVCSPPSSSGEDTEKQLKDMPSLKSKSCNADSNWSDSVGSETKAVTKTNSRRSQIFGLVFGRRSNKEEGSINRGEENVRSQSMERAEMAADLMDLKWSTNLASSPRENKDNGVEIEYLASAEYVVETATSIERVIREEDVTISSNSETGISDEIGLTISEVAKSDLKSQESSGIGSDGPPIEEKNESFSHGGCEEVPEEDEVKEPLCGPHISISEFGPQELIISKEEQLFFGEEKEADCPVFSLDQSVINDYLDESNLHRVRLRSVSSDACINENGDFVHTRELTRTGRSLPSMAHLGDNLETGDFVDSLDSSLYLGVDSDVKMIVKSDEEVAKPSDNGGEKFDQIGREKEDSEDTYSDIRTAGILKFKRREEYSYIHLLYPNARQTTESFGILYMFFNGNGFNCFFVVQENGYELLFLSARSISQSFLTRQFLFNIKQDGKALPEGPVVISPDGLFPSLFREVVRRAPHEFKIACLADIKALFPADTNPFYAGFGNRDTDEFSYLKVGIPRGKIFIINPKGEIAVNRRVDTQSYVSLHDLVHDMFPIMSSTSDEQEDFNSWNFWKLPTPVIDF
ncbi:hypothetical protein MIMGU_mgv1a002462mg [Erythranthe guttata]|uniref:LNS2/PITP domain-containing protein n=1 Tax=Erythranthe guttata TaxID=4155 RepID=A0A022QFV6_ERYGU|nr:hypothetical protein MIMGU_mgv1a002462mg [Erythranthe guttata]